MGLQPIEEYAWFDVDENLSSVLAAKRLLLDTQHAEVFSALPEADAAAFELLWLLADHLPRYHKATFQQAGDALINAATDERWDIAHPALHPLDIAGRLVAEDLCLLQRSRDQMILAGASLCSPARWLLAEKIGRPVRAIHAPVPGYADALGAPVDRFLEALKPGRIFARFNWGIADDPTPFQPVAAPPATDIAPVNAGETLWLRVERQTLRRLPETGAILFAIGTSISLLADAIETSENARDLAGAIRALPPEMQAYKRIAPYTAALLGWLDARVAT